ncbi:hypothetical protein KAM472_04580 [Aeromonas caviae]|nr:hypothetical protein KAM465_07770 [Aeromonas caviae]GKR13521.1 hypothetical protein KAM466_08390 [Aeromonas caviae]GKR18122.1 hypothetical protein KAM467_11660 [Aeromonas caviae]GKR38762.1 hypothetical protein KAM472_04580 [Aeromonas caviae]GKR51474.1 hypothetical protein KAM475_06210 [Aeromonas caviae]
MLTGEHATELEIHQLGLQLVRFDHGFVEGLFVFAFDGQADQHLDVIDALGQGIDGADDVLQGDALLAQRLCALGFVPDIRLFQLGIDLFQTLFLGVIVKGTP